MSVVPFPTGERQRLAEQREIGRLQAVHCDRRPLVELTADLGTPAEWLEASIAHLKAQTSGLDSGAVDVSVAAVHLLLMHLEALEYGGEPWAGNEA